MTELTWFGWVLVCIGAAALLPLAVWGVMVAAALVITIIGIIIGGFFCLCLGIYRMVRGFIQ